MAFYSIPPIGPGWQLAALVARYRFSETLGRDVVAVLEGAYREIAERIRTGPILTLRDRSALEDRFLEIRRLLAEAYGTAESRTIPVLREYVALEREIAARQLAAMQAVQAARQAGVASPIIGAATEIATTAVAPGAVSVVTTGLPRQLVVSAARLTEIVRTIDVGGIGFGDWWTKARTDGIDRVRRLIQTGVVQGLHPTQIATRIWASGATPGPNAWRQSRTVAHSVARTVVAALQTDAQLAAEAQFPQVIRGYYFRAVLDARTSDICRGLADTEWRADDPRMPRPPLHPNCRSTLEPIVDVPGIAASTSQQPTYEQWLRTQPPNVQALVLGKGVAAHWRQGKATLADMLAVDRTPMNLAQLRRALYTAQPESYVAWVESLPAAVQRDVLGASLARKVASGSATVAEVLTETADRGIITRE